MKFSCHKAFLMLLSICLLVFRAGAAQPDEAKIARVLDAYDAFEKVFRASTNHATTATAAVDFIKTLDRELPAKQADIIASGLADFYFNWSGFWGFQQYTAQLNENRRASMRAKAHANWQPFFQQADGLGISAGGAPTQLQEAASKHWPPTPRQAPGTGSKAEFVDMKQVRVRAIFNADPGACYDIFYAAYYADGIPQDRDWANVWALIAKQINPDMFKKLSLVKVDGLEGLRIQAGAGCTWAMLRLGEELASEGTGPIFPGEPKLWLDRAAALGSAKAANMLKTRGVMDGQSDIARINRLLAATEDFERKFNAATNLVDAAADGAVFARAIEKDSSKILAGLLVRGLADYFYNYAGLQGYSRFVQDRTDKELFIMTAAFPNERKAMIEQARALVKDGKVQSTAFQEMLGKWPTQARQAVGAQMPGEWLDLKSLRVKALVEGRYGACLDLAFASGQGTDVPKDADLYKLWSHTAAYLEPVVHRELLALTWGSTAAKQVLARVGSAVGMTELADELNKGNTTNTPVPAALPLYQQAAALGHKGSARLLANVVPVLPANSSTVNAATNNSVNEFLAELERFDRAVHAASSVEEFGEPCAQLVKALDKMSDKKLADAVFLASLEFLHLAGGANGYYTFMMNIPESRLNAANALNRTKLTELQKNLIKALSSQTLSKLYNQPFTPADTRSWPSAKDRKRGGVAADHIDITKVRLALLRGTIGAAADLELAYAIGWGVLKDEELGGFWGLVAEKLIPGFEEARGNPEKHHQLLVEAGSADALLRRAVLLQKDNPKSAVVQNLLSRAAEGGAKEAARYLSKKADFEQKEKAFESMTEEQGKQLARALEEFDQTTLKMDSLSDWGRHLGLLVNALDAQPNWFLAQAVFQNSSKFAEKFSGANGYKHFYTTLGEARKNEAWGLLPADKKSLMQKMLMGGALSLEEMKTWEPRQRGIRSSFRVTDYDLFRVRLALAVGMDGAAFDLSDIYDAGGKPIDDDLKLFWIGIAFALVPEADNEKNDRIASEKAIIDAGGAKVCYLAARVMNGKKQGTLEQVIELVQIASWGGYKPADTFLASLKAAQKNEKDAPILSETIFQGKATQEFLKEKVIPEYEALAEKIAQAVRIGKVQSVVVDGKPGADPMKRNFRQLMADNRDNDTVNGVYKFFTPKILALEKEVDAMLGVQTLPPPRVRGLASSLSPVVNKVGNIQTPTETSYGAGNIVDAKLGNAAVNLKMIHDAGLSMVRSRLGDLERGQSANDSEIAALRETWKIYSEAKSPTRLANLQTNIYALMAVTHVIPTMLNDNDVKANIRQAQVKLFVFDLPATSDPVSLIKIAEEVLGRVVNSARKISPEQTMAAVYRAAAERSRFPDLCPLNGTSSEKEILTYRMKVNSLEESAELLEEFKKGTVLQKGSPIKMPDELVAARAWPALKNLELAADKGNIPDVIHYLNQLSLSLRAVALQRAPDGKLPTLPFSFERLIVTPDGGAQVTP